MSHRCESVEGLRARALLACLTVAVLAVGSARAGHEATFVLDRTYACAIPLHGGIYKIENRAHPGTRQAGKWAKLAYAGVRSGVFSGPNGNLLVWVSAGAPTKTTTVDQEYWTFDVKTFGTVGVRRALCTPSTARVALNASGLRGGAADPLGSELRCESPKRVLVRLRAVLTTRAVLRGREYATAHVPIREAKLSVRTIDGKTLSFATVSRSGKASLHTAKGCVPE